MSAPFRRSQDWTRDPVVRVAIEAWLRADERRVLRRLMQERGLAPERWLGISAFRGVFAFSAASRCVAAGVRRGLEPSAAIRAMEREIGVPAKTYRTRIDRGCGTNCVTDRAEVA